MRKELHLSETDVPATVAKAMKSSAQQSERRPARDGEERRAPREGGYRRRDDGEKKSGAQSTDFKPEFRGGLWRDGGANAPASPASPAQ